MQISGGNKQKIKAQQVKSLKGEKQRKNKI